MSVSPFWRKKEVKFEGKKNLSAFSTYRRDILIEFIALIFSIIEYTNFSTTSIPRYRISRRYNRYRYVFT